MSEPDEHVLAGTFQAFGVVLDEPDETVDVIVFFEVNGQYVARGRFSPVAIPVSPIMQRSLLRVKRIETYNQSPQYYRITRHFERLRRVVGSEFSRMRLLPLK
jgi:hypothetical protein